MTDEDEDMGYTIRAKDDLAFKLNVAKFMERKGVEKKITQRKVIDYDVVSISDANQFVERVNEKIKDGWELFGNPFSIHDEVDEEDCFVQAMVKYGY